MARQTVALDPEAVEAIRRLARLLSARENRRVTLSQAVIQAVKSLEEK